MMTYIQIIGELLQADLLRVGPAPAELCSLVVEHPPLRVVSEAQVRQHLGPPLPQRVRQHQTLVVRVLINYSKLNRNQRWDPDPHVFGPPGSGSISQMYGSGSGSDFRSFPFLINVLSRLK
jgi:hypothetical protein